MRHSIKKILESGIVLSQEAKNKIKEHQETYARYISGDGDVIGGLMLMDEQVAEIKRLVNK